MGDDEAADAGLRDHRAGVRERDARAWQGREDVALQAVVRATGIAYARPDEPEALRQGGADHVLWGTDYLISMVHGKAISVGEGFAWLYPHALPEGIDLPVSLTVLESLFAFYQAALMLDLGRPELDGIFFRNAERLFGV